MNQPISDKQWQARDDAHTLASSEEIKSDPSRANAARVEAKKMVEESKQRSESLKKVAESKTPQNVTTQSTNSFSGVVDVTKLANTGGQK